MNKKRQCTINLRFKILFVFILIGIPYICASAYSQTVRVSIHMSRAPIEEVFKELEQKTDYVFLYKNEIIKGKDNVNINATNELLTQVLSNILSPLGLSYAIDDNVIVVNAADKALQSPQQQSQNLLSVTGVVRDDKGESLPGVSIVLKGTMIGTSTDIDGKYRLAIPKGLKDPVIVYSFIGMGTVEIQHTGQKSIDVVLKDGETLLKSVVVEAGIMQHNKLGFTGSYRTVSSKELKAVGNTNILQSLKTLDPSFVITDNISFGSDPNTMANINIRGQNTMDITATREQATSRANTPLFMLDGFEASIEEVNDMDINRIESITILKDAGSTAIYGAKGANGVVVFETVKPKAGEIMVTYNGNYKLSFADLSVYNMMNASEKLEFERLAGRYTLARPSEVAPYQQTYYDRLAQIAQGVNTYWLHEPIRTGFTHKHSLNIQGGEKNLLFDVGVNFSNDEGVMKDSGRETYAANFRLIYRGINNLNISNNAYVSGSNANNGAWTTGNSFQDFINANPYFVKRNKDGSIPILLDSQIKSDQEAEFEGLSSTADKNRNAYNPLYNASLNSYQRDRRFYFTNNTLIEWRVFQDLRVSGALSLKREIVDYDKYIDPLNTEFIDASYLKKGNYLSKNTNEWSVAGRFTANYLKTFANLHNVTVGLVGTLEEENYRLKGFEAEGFPLGSSGKLPSAAQGFKEDSTPNAQDVKKRTVSGVFHLNYNYDFRYLLDFSITEDGSTAFGKNKKFEEFWSVGIGWNLEREKFAKNWGDWLTRLKINATIGTNANQETNSNAVSSSVYSFYQGNTYFGQGARLYQVGNPDLDWQKITKREVKLDAALFDERLLFDVGFYNNKTKPMVTPLDMKPSSGVSNYPVNLGHLTNKGVDFSVLFFPIYDMKREILLSIRLTGAHNRSRYGGIGNTLDKVNAEFETSPYSPFSTQKYQDGESSKAIWAVKSLGIDPASGKEVYLKKDGTQTFDFDITDRVNVGDMEPDLRGSIGLNFMFKQLEANFVFMYSLGGDILNTSLYNNVENITKSNLVYNKDKRALYDRWKKPGDITEFTSIAATASGQALSSRFVQREHYLTGESAKISWDFSRNQWLKKFRLKTFKAGISMNSVFRLSTVKTERGTSYPFNRVISFDLMARF